MVQGITTLIPYSILASHVAFGILVLAIFTKTYFGRKIKLFVGTHAEKIVFALSLAAILGSLFYSEVLGYEPCVLCWWQRVFLYPLPVILGVALWQRDKYVFKYVFPLVTLSAIVALYQSYVALGGTSLLPCTAVGGACSKLYVNEFGYITIPSMSFTIAVYILVVIWIKNKYDQNSNAR